MGSVHGKEAGMTDMTPEQRAEFREKAAAAMERGATTSKAALAQDLTGFRALFPPRWTINKRWEWVKFALKGRLREFRATN